MIYTNPKRSFYNHSAKSRAQTVCSLKMMRADRIECVPAVLHRSPRTSSPQGNKRFKMKGREQSVIVLPCFSFSLFTTYAFFISLLK